VTISATNGQDHDRVADGSILASAGIARVDNFAGANMAGGVASALLARGGRERAQIGVFEVDDFWLASGPRPRSIRGGS